MKDKKNSNDKAEKNLDHYIELAKEQTKNWPEWKRNMFTPAPVSRQKTV